ncbi:hypothetical protein EGW08_003806, partial [Elysia chlorotica]
AIDQSLIKSNVSTDRVTCHTENYIFRTPLHNNLDYRTPCIVMEKPTVLVNGQGVSSAKYVSDVSSEEEVASILENISNLVDNTPDVHKSHSLCKDDQNIEQSSLLLSKSNFPDVTDTQSEGGNGSKGDNAVEKEMFESSCCELSQKSISSLPEVSALKESSNHSQSQSSPASAKIESGDYAKMAPCVGSKKQFQCLSSKSNLADSQSKDGLCSKEVDPCNTEMIESRIKSSEKCLSSPPSENHSANESVPLFPEPATTTCEHSFEVTALDTKEINVISLPPSSLKHDSNVTSPVTEPIENSFVSKEENNKCDISAPVHSHEASDPLPISHNELTLSASEKPRGTIIALSKETEDQNVLLTKLPSIPRNKENLTSLDDSGSKSPSGSPSNSQTECSNNQDSNIPTTSLSKEENQLTPKQNSSSTPPLASDPDVQQNAQKTSPHPSASVSELSSKNTPADLNASNSQLSEEVESLNKEMGEPAKACPKNSDGEMTRLALPDNSPSEPPDCATEIKSENKFGSILSAGTVTEKGDMIEVASSSKDITVLPNSCQSVQNEHMIVEEDASDLCSVKILESLNIRKTNGLVEEHKVNDGARQSEEDKNPATNKTVQKNQSSVNTENSSTPSLEKVVIDIVENENTNMNNNVEILNKKQEETIVDSVNDEVALRANDKLDLKICSQTAEHTTECSVESNENMDSETCVKSVEKDTDVSNQDENKSVIVIGEESESKSTEEEVKNNSFEDKSKIINTSSENISPDEEKSDLQMSSSEVSDKNVKKRSFSSEETTDEEPKRLKLDEDEKDKVSETIQNEAMEVIDSDDVIILAEDPVTEKKIQSSSKVECLQKDNVDDKLADQKDKKDLKDIKNQNFSPINLSSQVLQAFITARIKAFMKKQKQQQIDKLNQKISVMQSSTSLWKETAKHLERSVKEVTVINQGVEKRRAHVNACKKFSSRTVGTQVNDDKVKSAQTSIQDPTRGPETISSNSSLGPSVLLNPATSQQPSQQQRPWRNQQNANTLPGRSQVPPLQPSAPASSSRLTRPSEAPAGHARPPPPTSEVVNLIDLTDDDDISKKNSQQILLGTNSSQHPMALGNRTNVSGYPGPGKAAQAPPAGVNGFIPLSQGRTVVSNGVQHHPQAQTMVTAAALANNQLRPNARLVQLPNHPLAPAAVGRSPNVGASSQSVSVPGKQQAHEASNTALSNSKSNWITKHSLPPSLFIQQQRHPAPLPQNAETVMQDVRALKLPPKPSLKISRVSQGIVLSWNMPSLLGVEVITSYQLFAYQETDSAPKTSLWKKVGDVRALPLPMACTLTQFLEGNKYHFAVRAIDKFNRSGAFSDPSSIFLGIGSTNTKIPLRG